MNLTVITHTRGAHSSPWLEECKASVAAALPPGAIHQIIELPDCTPRELMQARWESLPADGYFCFVDDDDRIVNNSLNICLSAIAISKAGCVFTGESKIDASGARTGASAMRPMDYFEATIHPLNIHHLCLMRRDAIDQRCWDLQEKYGIGLEWFMKANAAIAHRAVQVPIIGYEWRIHGRNHSLTADWEVPYARYMHKMCDDLVAWQQYRGPIPRWGS